MSTPIPEPYPETISELQPGTLNLQLQRPTSWCVVMGASGKAEHEVHWRRLQEDQVPLYKRRGGGGTVLLGPNTLVMTIHAWVQHYFHNLRYFSTINRALIDVFRTWKPLEYQQRGFSDIAVDDRKILGSSIFRRRNILLYQASLLVDVDRTRIDRYLKHPPREPDYRQGRDHAGFVTSLRELGVQTPDSHLRADLRTMLPEPLRRALTETDSKIADLTA